MSESHLGKPKNSSGVGQCKHHRLEEAQRRTEEVSELRSRTVSNVQPLLIPRSWASREAEARCKKCQIHCHGWDVLSGARESMVLDFLHSLLPEYETPGQQSCYTLAVASVQGRSHIWPGNHWSDVLHMPFRSVYSKGPVSARGVC